MITADLVVIGAIAFCIIVGAIVGFGKELRFFTSGVFGKIISVVVCYFLYGIVLNWSFVQVLMLKLTTALSENGSWICNILLSIRIDLIAFGVVLFAAVQILRSLVVAIISHVFEINNKFISVINRLLGVVLLAAFVVIFALVAFQIIAWTSGVDGAFYQSLNGSAFKLDEVFRNNPVNSIFESIRMQFAGDTAPAEE
ncbi:MAG: hypothetical protein IJU83_03595 [Clostridia bacterium]|nr:hypothetical protein [Clostridia bacterium]